MFSLLFIFASFILLIFLLIGSSLPNCIDLNEEIDIKTEPEEAFLQFADLKSFIAWSPLFLNIPISNIIFEGERLTVGDTVRFRKKINSFEKSISISHMEINEKIFFEFDFGFRNKGKMQININQMEKGETTIYWNFSLYLGNNPIERLYGFFMKNNLKKSMTIGLKKLKEKLETS